MSIASDQPGDGFFLGLDLGQSHDFSALVALRRRGRGEERRYTARGIRRWPTGTKYTAVAADLAKTVAEAPLRGCTVGVDKTGVGAAVYELIEAAQPAANLSPVLITAGHRSTFQDGEFHVAKRDLVGVLQALLQCGRIEIPKTLPEAATLEKELLSFRAKITAAGNETFAADESDWRTRPYDDLVLALAIAAWLAERTAAPAVPLMMPRQIMGAPAPPDRGPWWR